MACKGCGTRRAAMPGPTCGSHAALTTTISRTPCRASLANSAAWHTAVLDNRSMHNASSLHCGVVAGFHPGTGNRCRHMGLSRRATRCRDGSRSAEQVADEERASLGSNGGSNGNGNGNGNGFYGNEAFYSNRASRSSVSSYDEENGNGASGDGLPPSGEKEKGNLDHLMDSKRKVEASNSGRPVNGDEEVDENSPTPASSWLPYSPVVAKVKPAPALSIEALAKENLAVMFSNSQRRLLRIPEVISSAVTFRLQQVMLSNIAVKLAAVFIFALPAVIVGGEIYSLLTGSSVWEGFIKIYSTLYLIPGVNVLAEDNAPSFILVNAIFLLGTFFFAVVLGVVSDDIGNELKAIRSGNYPVLVKNHILVLNWNRQTPPLLRQIALAEREASVGGSHGKRTVVVLAQHEKTWMDSEVQSALKGYDISWQTREGAPYSANDLARVSAGAADTIILLRPQNGRIAEDPNDCPIVGLPDPNRGIKQNIAAQEVAAILGINAQRDAPHAQQQNIIVQAPEDAADAVAAAKRVIAPQFNALGLRDQRDMTRLIAQSALQPGVASVQCAILQKAPGSVSFYLRQFDSLAGLTYEEARRRFSGAVMCGYVREGEWAARLNPAPDEKLEAGDRVVLLAPQGRLFACKDEAAPEYQELGDIFEGVTPLDWSPPQPKVGPRKVVVAGWCGEVEDLTASLTMFSPEGTDVVMICPCAPEGMPTGNIDGINFYHLPGDPHNTMCLEEAGVAEADAIIIGPADNLSSKEADAQMLSEMMLVQDILIASKRDRSSPAHVVAVVRCPQTIKVANYMVRDLAKGTMTAELMQPDELVSGLIAQVSSEPALAALLSQIIDSAHGVQVRLREPEAFQLTDVRATSFAEVAERARALQETAFGYITRQGTLVLAPPAGSAHVFRNTDRVVVFAGKQAVADEYIGL